MGWQGTPFSETGLFRNSKPRRRVLTSKGQSQLWALCVSNVAVNVSLSRNFNLHTEILRRYNNSACPQDGGAAIVCDPIPLSHWRGQSVCHPVDMNRWAYNRELIIKEPPQLHRLQLERNARPPRMSKSNNPPASTMWRRHTGRRQSKEERRRNKGGERRKLQANEKQDDVDPPSWPW